MNDTDKCFKKCYQTNREAKKYLKLMNTTKPHLGLTATYFCSQCQCYHVTSMNKKRSRNFTRTLNK